MGTRSGVDIVGRAFAFSGKVVRLAQGMDRRRLVDQTLTRQLLRSATSIGANIEKAQAAYSKAEFIAKMSIA